MFLLWTIFSLLMSVRCVVWTSPSLDVASRLSHGLANEGVRISKYFIAEMSFLLCGWFTYVREIQEFCTLAFVGLVVDFYMQVSHHWLLITHLHEYYEYYIIAIFLHPVSGIWFAKPRRGRERAISLFDGFRNRYTNVEKLQTFDVGILLLNFLLLLNWNDISFSF